MYQLSYPDIFFSDEKHKPQSEFAKKFLESIPKDQIVCFWPRSFVPSNNHKLLIESIRLIKQDKPEILNNFKLYLWGGNSKNEKIFKDILDAIEIDDLSNNIEIVEHPFVPQNDIFAIEERSNFFVQITNDDILSSFVMEILCSCKPFVLSNIRSYQFLNEIYNLNVPLVENKIEKIADKICKILNKEEIANQAEFNGRKELCRKIFSKTTNKSSALILYENL
jgi:glycosyltransferase involved in cell wall biosynthesis